ncbi:hypothetical protein CL6EHI_162810 [Entamoeba histolytica]|uniref:Uncharacterized protein n=2 Tax=Entamoeba histolytica TaxID=5759 RepID=C4MBD1_ENTH1|nr:hypothetical protein EHI_162810 [Entamoeba histolytica HM-1:IMSS]EAL50065.1 hypothetical protein EHI_162810 [Entamoeba histolytica HM-1:IMSS]GAT99276.1 hypothetical protein CL6EHI_162810 [Entamoeba histolytica]|eukprot:XP_655447.1 hypothetical protein EHI_162810 [Entamoeba histolytica HM-1:IMSS]
MSVIKGSCYESLSDRFKLLFLILEDNKCDEMSKMIQFYSDNYDFDNLYENYEFYHNCAEMQYDIIEVLKSEIIYILAIIDKTKRTGVKFLSQEVIDRLLFYIDDWWLRDGIYDVYDVATELFKLGEEKP